MPPKPLSSMILLRDERLPGEADVLERITQWWPDLGPIGHVKRIENVLTFDVDEETLVVSLMPAAIPWADLTGPCSAAWYWPQAGAELRDHAAHLLVVFLSADPDRTNASLRFTRLLAALTDCCKAAGVFWGGGGLVHEPAVFIAAARDSSRQALPLQLWIGYNLRGEEDGTHSLYTSGMEAFGQMEIEIVHSPSDPKSLYDRIRDVTHYALDRNILFKDGDTVGGSEGERIEITEGPSMCDGATTVIQLAL